MDDVVQRLRAGLEAGAIDLADIMDAADEIERLRHGTAVSENCVAGNHPEIPCPTNHDAAPAAKANAESVVPQPTAGDRSGNPTSRSGTGDSLSEAEIDALECVVEDGRIVRMSVYGRLRSLLVRLRPEWDGEPYEKSDEKRGDSNTLDRLAALERLSALDQELERTHGVRHTQSECTKQGDGIVPDSRNANEPVAWGVMRVGGGWVSILGNAVQAETSRQSFDKMENWVHEVVPLYRAPTLTDAEREALSWFTGGRGPVCPQHLATIRNLMARFS